MSVTLRVKRLPHGEGLPLPSKATISPSRIILPAD